MSLWLLIVLATAAGGALLLWHAVSHIKNVSVEMLGKYAEMLADSRETRAKALAEESDEPDVFETAPPPEP